MDEIALNRQIAELLGYKVVKLSNNEDGDFITLISPTGEEIRYTRFYGDKYGEQAVWDSFTAPVYREIMTNAPKWATDTDAALTLLDQLPSGLWVEIHRGYARAIMRMCWYCQIITVGDEKLANAERCSTQAEAVCRAFIEYKQKASRSS